MSEELRTAVDEAMAPVVGRHEVEQLQAKNNATVQRLAQQGIGIAPHDIVSLHLAVLLDQLYGDIDDPRRQAYEMAVHTRMAELLDDIGTQAARAKLMQGIAGDLGAIKRPGRER